MTAIPTAKTHRKRFEALNIALDKVVLARSALKTAANHAERGGMRGTAERLREQDEDLYREQTAIRDERDRLAVLLALEPLQPTRGGA